MNHHFAISSDNKTSFAVILHHQPSLTMRQTKRKKPFVNNHHFIVLGAICTIAFGSQPHTALNGVGFSVLFQASPTKKLNTLQHF